MPHFVPQSKYPYKMGRTTHQTLIKELEREHGLDPNIVVRDVKRYLKGFHEKKFLRAFMFAAVAHQGQVRKSGEPYILHPFETVKILTSLHVDEDTLIAALLHDVPEDTDKTIKDIEVNFGKKVAYLVEGITKLSKVYYKNDMAKRQVDSLKKLFMHTAHDPRIILIKLADRTHNMRTLHFLDKPEKRKRIARETLEIFVPIANLLGIEELKSELEDLCFHELHSEEYDVLADRCKSNRKNNDERMDKTIASLHKELKKHGINASVHGRIRNLYSLYKRLNGDLSRLAENENEIAIRILVSDKDECYQVLGVLHSMFKPKPGMFADYIAVPKRNGYRSLHTTVFGCDGVATSYQVRTHQMHLEAQYGIASHYFLDNKDEKGSTLLEEDARAQWAAKVVQLQKDEARSNNSADFMDQLVHDILHDRIFVFTPKGDSVDLPKDASCIDFAYEIHADVGHRALRAEVNGKIVPMTTKLENGDTVHVITSDIAKAPSRQWLGFVQTTAARNRIQDYFKRVSEDEKLKSGQDLLQKELDRAGLGMVKNIAQKKVHAFCDVYENCHTMDDILIAIGEGAIRPIDFINTLYPERDKSKKITKKKEQSHKTVGVKIVSRDSVGQLMRIMGVIKDFDISSLKTKAYRSMWGDYFICKMLMCAKSYAQISELFEHLEQVDGVIRVERMFWQRRALFLWGLVLTFGVWVVHPHLLNYLATSGIMATFNPFLKEIVMYAGIFMLFFMVVLLKSFTQRSFPGLRENNLFWIGTFALNIFAMITIFAEIYFLNFQFNWGLVVVLIFATFAYLTSEYLSFKERD